VTEDTRTEKEKRQMQKLRDDTKGETTRQVTTSRPKTEYYKKDPGELKLNQKKERKLKKRDKEVESRPHIRGLNRQSITKPGGTQEKGVEDVSYIPG